MESTRTPKGQFKNGSSGNPAGRPVGSRNKTTLACERLLEDKLESLTKTLIKLARAGNIQALSMCADQIIPARKERCIKLESRVCQNSWDLADQFRDILAAIAAGRITPGEGESLSKILTSHAQVIKLLPEGPTSGARSISWEEFVKLRDSTSTTSTPSDPAE